MISINDISFYFGSRPLYHEASLHIKPKSRIGLIGANGTGKSTLLRVIAGEYKIDSGSISKSGDCTIGFLNQDLLSYQTNDSILSVAMQAFERQNELQKQINEVLHQMEINYEDSQVTKLTRLQEEFETLDGYTIQSKAEEVLEGLGFLTKDLERPLQEFSGGWRMRVMLAKLLLQKPDLLMLDEPTNHLDLPSIVWVESYLTNYEGALMVVSHDRYFLDRTVTSIVEVSQGKLNFYSGNYSFFMEEKSLRNEIQKNSFENQQQKIRQTERFIDRFKAKASKARQVQSRVKMLDKIDLIEEVADADAKVNFRFTFDVQSGRFVSNLENLHKSYGDLTILKDANGVIERGSKIALIGANGKGKSTLLRILAGTEAVDGDRRLGHNVILSLYAQHQLESLNVENSVLEELKQAGSNKNDTELRAVLGCFLFTDEDVFKKIKVLSGGEKSRVALAKTLVSKANFLLLDEPTNHLDMQSVNILIQALQQYEGTFVTISHDRHFISQVANKIWYIEDHEIKEYPGTYAEYEYWQQQRKYDSPKNEKVKFDKEKVAKKLVSEPERKQSEKELKQLKSEVWDIEKRISELESKIKQAEDELAKPSVYGDPTRLAEANKIYNKIKVELDSANDQWETKLTRAEKLEKELA
ncbi:MAG: ABC transporter ATP-binding protein [Bacteroidetes bacterium]|nr:MAG: ABC transporter ATP-binding protein [Bacteroidota bacterium]